jgi:hypothetical protein
VSKRLNTEISTKIVKPMLSHMLKSRVSTIHPTTPIKPRTTTGKPLLSHWRSTSATKGRTWFIAPLRLKDVTSPRLISITKRRTYSKRNTTKLNSLPPASRPKELNRPSSQARNSNFPALCHNQSDRSP